MCMQIAEQKLLEDVAFVSLLFFFFSYIKFRTYKWKKKLCECKLNYLNTFKEDVLITDTMNDV